SICLQGKRQHNCFEFVNDPVCLEKSDRMGDVDSSTNRILNPVSIKKIGGKKIIEINILFLPIFYL
ncbi:hypothetical protein, partial [Akkermansia muciniphila]|uniref:hypothetical protein n=1 Tax=Akkermansia muciniphila TaxID=239935 RepID=UPI001CA53875